MTVNPSAFNFSQIARPMPRVPPVTIATRPISPSTNFSYDEASGAVREGKQKTRRSGLGEYEFRNRGSEAQLGTDVNGLAVLRRIGQRGEPVTFLRQTHTGGHIEIARDAIGTAQINRLRSKRLVSAFRTPCLALAFERNARAESIGLVSARFGWPEACQVGHFDMPDAIGQRGGPGKALVAARRTQIIAAGGYCRQ